MTTNKTKRELVQEAKRQGTLRERRKEAGYVRVETWIKASKKPMLKILVEKLNNE